MKKEEFINRYGEDAWQRKLERARKGKTKEAIIARRGEDAYKKKLERHKIRLRKAEFIEQYGEEAYKRKLKRSRESRRKDEIIARYGEEEYKKRLAVITKKQRKKEFIEQYGEEAYKKRLKRVLEWQKAHPEQRWYIRHPEEAKALQKEACRKGGKYYEKRRECDKKGLRHERILVRMRHRNEFREIKDTLAVEVELHHEWIGDTAEYMGMAFVESNAHRKGFIDVILFLDGEITIYDFT